MSKANASTPTEEINHGASIAVLRDIPFQLGRYRVVQRIAIRPSGGEVFLAIDNKLSADSRVVIKLLAQGRGAERESEQASRVDHPNVARVTDWGQFEERQYVVYEYVEGDDLSDARGALRSREAVSIMSMVARGVHRLHQMGDVHGDIKPDNIMVTEHGPKVLDFGSAVRVGEVSQCSEAFGSPEQMDTGATFASDVYGLGKTIAWLLRERDMILDKIIDKATADDPEHRYHDAGVLATDLEAWLNRKPIGWTKPGLRRVGWCARRHPIVAAMFPIVVGGSVWMGANLYQNYALAMRENRLTAAFGTIQQAEEIWAEKGSPTEVDADNEVLQGLRMYTMDPGNTLLVATKAEALAWRIRANVATAERDMDGMKNAAEALKRFDEELSKFDDGCPTHSTIISGLIGLYHSRNLNDSNLQLQYNSRGWKMQQNEVMTSESGAG